LAAITAACTASGSFEAPRSLRGLLASPATPSRRHRSYQTRSVFSGNGVLLLGDLVHEASEFTTGEFAAADKRAEHAQTEQRHLVDGIHVVKFLRSVEEST
jgi:hypothetical protein